MQTEADPVWYVHVIVPVWLCANMALVFLGADIYNFFSFFFFLFCSDYRIQGHFSLPHLHMSENFVQRGILRWAVLLFNNMQICRPVFCSLAARKFYRQIFSPNKRLNLICAVLTVSLSAELSQERLALHVNPTSMASSSTELERKSLR